MAPGEACLLTSGLMATCPSAARELELEGGYHRWCMDPSSVFWREQLVRCDVGMF